MELFSLSKGIFRSSLISRYNMSQCNSCRLSINTNVYFQKEIGTILIDPFLYRSLVGSVIYLSNTRLDICTVTRIMNKPEIVHLSAKKKLLHYLKGTMDHDIFMPVNSTTNLRTYVDVDWGCKLDTRRSTCGILHSISDAIYHGVVNCSQQSLYPQLKLNIGY